jgi:DNA modification methylase
MSIRILQGDCREVLRTLADNSVDSIVTDPPYGLTAGKKGGSGEASVNLNTPQGRARVTTGFMGMKWDADVPPVEVWAECLRVLKPGGYLLAFAGTRTQHRMATRIEDAGFEIRDMIAWVYGSGFPKSHNGPWGGTALKPALEPITMARKPLAGTVEANWREHGTGALNIDGCRVLVDGEDRAPITGKGGMPARHTVDAPREGGIVAQPHELGRWPANLVHDGSDEVVAQFPAQAGAQAPVTVRNGDKFRSTYGAFKGNRDEQGSTFQGDTGSAARFFYCAKADKSDRNDGGANNTHPTVKPTDLMRYLCRLVTPAGGVVLDPFMGSGSTLKAAELEGFGAIGIELDPDYIAIARRRIAADAPLFAEVNVGNACAEAPS